MSSESLVFEVTEASYGKYVLLNSHKVPVVMACIAVWSEHCGALDNLFTALAQEFSEQFVFARLDVDENEATKNRYEIKNVPTIIVFKDGEPVRREEGVLSEEEARALLKDFGITRESDEIRLQARQIHMQGDTPKAVTLLAEAMKSDPTNIRIALDMVQIFIDISELDEAGNLLSRLPQAAQDSDSGRSLQGQIWAHKQAAKTEGIEKLQQRLSTNDEDFDAHFDLSICESARNNYPEAMTHLFRILEQQPEYRDGAAREMIVLLIETLAVKNPEMAGLYRRQLAQQLNN